MGPDPRKAAIQVERDAPLSDAKTNGFCDVSTAFVAVFPAFGDLALSVM
jgi:hypothetical protein